MRKGRVWMLTHLCRTFSLANEPLNEPPEKLREAKERAKEAGDLQAETFTTCRLGETTTIKCGP